MKTVYKLRLFVKPTYSPEEFDTIPEITSESLATLMGVITSMEALENTNIIGYSIDKMIKAEDTIQSCVTCKNFGHASGIVNRCAMCNDMSGYERKEE